MAKIFFAKTVRYKGQRYTPNTVFEVDDSDITDLKVAGGWIVEEPVDVQVEQDAQNTSLNGDSVTDKSLDVTKGEDEVKTEQTELDTNLTNTDDVTKTEETKVEDTKTEDVKKEEETVAPVVIEPVKKARQSNSNNRKKTKGV